MTPVLSPVPSLARRALLRSLLFLALLPVAGCSVLPDRPFQETRRFALAPERPRRQAAPAGAPVLLLRGIRAAPGLDVRGLRVAGPGQQVDVEYWNEWAAPPAELVEEAMRRWLGAAGLFGAVTAPGSRLRSSLVLEGELIRLQAEPGAGERGQARVALSMLLLREGSNGEARILGQFLPEGTAPLPGERARDGRPAAADAAAAMNAALGAALAALEGELRRVVR